MRERESGEEFGNGASTDGFRASDLRSGLAEARDMVSETTASSYRRVEQMITDHPLAAVATAAAAGALLAIVIARMSTGPGSSADYRHMLDRIARAGKETAAPLMPAVERVADAMSGFEGLPAPLSNLHSLWRTIIGR